MRFIICGFLVLAVFSLSACEPITAKIFADRIKQSIEEDAKVKLNDSQKLISDKKLETEVSINSLTSKQCSEESDLKSSQDANIVKLKFQNDSEQSLKFYWLDFNGKRKLYKTLAKGQDYTQSTFVTHPWLITDKDDNCVGIYIPEKAGEASLIINKITEK